MLSGLTKKTCILVIVINNEPILSSMLAVGIVQDTFAGETVEGERGRRSGDDWRLFLLVSRVPDTLAVRRESGQTAYYVSCKLAKKSLAC